MDNTRNSSDPLSHLIHFYYEWTIHGEQRHQKTLVTIHNRGSRYRNKITWCLILQVFDLDGTSGYHTLATSNIYLVTSNMYQSQIQRNLSQGKMIGYFPHFEYLRILSRKCGRKQKLFSLSSKIINKNKIP